MHLEPNRFHTVHLYRAAIGNCLRTSRELRGRAARQKLAKSLLAAIAGVLAALVMAGACSPGSGSAVHSGSGGTPVDGSVIGGSHGGPGSGGSGNGGSRGSGGSGGAPSLSSAAGFGPAFEQAMCATLAMCGGYPDVATCKADTVFAEGSLIETTVTHVQQGLVR